MPAKHRPTAVEKERPEAIYKTLTKEQRAMIDKVKAGRHDPVFFAYEILGIELHDGQKLWLWMTTQTQVEQAFELGVKMGKWPDREAFDLIRKNNPDFLRNILVPSNRWGKTLVTSVKHLWYCYYKIGVKGDWEHVAQTRCGSLNLSPHSNQCQASYEYILDILFSKFTYRVEEDGKIVSRVNKCLIGDFYIGDNKQARMISFKNGTTFKAIPTGEDQASSLAGMRFLYISYDECAQSLHLKAELPAKIMSRLIDFGGPMDLVSTPEVDKPSHQYFFHIAKLGLKGEEGWFTLIGKLTDNKFIGENEIRTLGNAIRMTDPVKYRQVVYGEFVTTGKKMFDAVVIERLWDEELPRFPALDHKYLLWADWGFSDTGDPTVFYVIDYTPMKLPNGEMVKNRYRIAYRESMRGASPFAALARFRMLAREWNGAKAGHDSGNMGGVMIRKMLAEMGMAGVEDFSSGGDKADMLFCLLIALSDGRKPEYDSEGKITEKNPDFGRIRSYHIPELEEQMGNYQYNPDKGITDKKLTQDEVMCLGMAIWWLERKYNRSQLKAVDFNPLADTVTQVFGEKSAKELSMHTINIPEKTIL